MGTSAGTRLPPPVFMTNLIEWERKVVLWMAQAHQGHIANTGLVSLSTGVAATTLIDSRIGFVSYIGLMPITANAAAEIANGTIYIASQSDGAATITHANAGTNDRTFRFCILG